MTGNCSRLIDHSERVHIQEGAQHKTELSTEGMLNFIIEEHYEIQRKHNFGAPVCHLYGDASENAASFHSLLVCRQYVDEPAGTEKLPL